MLICTSRVLKCYKTTSETNTEANTYSPTQKPLRNISEVSEVFEQNPHMLCSTLVFIAHYTISYADDSS